MTTHVTHVRVVDTPPPSGLQVIGRMYPIGPEFKTTVPSYAPNFVDLDDEEEVDDETETKVMRRGRRPLPKANEDVETK